MRRRSGTEPQQHATLSPICDENHWACLLPGWLELPLLCLQSSLINYALGLLYACMSEANAHAKRPSSATVSFLNAMAKRTLRIAATADLHYAKHSRGRMQDAFAEISRSADVLLLCGDLTEYGVPEEAEELAADIRSAVRIPCIGVIGNHDYESGKPETVAEILDQTGVTMLNGEAVEIAGVGFAGICGFGGGFGRRMLNAWGEPLIKQFVQESISHAIRLEQALIKLQTERRIVVLHYSPIRATLQGKILKSTPFSAPVASKNRSTDFAPPRYSTVTYTTELPTGKRRLAFPFTTSLRLCCTKPENRTGS